MPDNLLSILKLIKMFSLNLLHMNPSNFKDAIRQTKLVNFGNPSEECPPILFGNRPADWPDFPGSSRKGEKDGGHRDH